MSRCLSSRPCLYDRADTFASTQSLVFPRWDIIAILFSVFLLTYVYIEAVRTLVLPS